MEGSLDQAPLALLTRSSLALESHFTVAFIVNEPGFTRFVLNPISADALFSRMEMVFHGEMLSAMSIFDHTGQQTLIRFADYLTQQVIQSSVFELEFPPGTDFVRG
jgi:outer membrane lipoprotein-sorting protein